MGRHTSTDGFTMVEMCVVILGISVLGIVFSPVRAYAEDSYDTFGDGYLKTQSEAIVSAQDQTYVSDDGKMVMFNGKGNVRKAETLSFGKKERNIIIELGGGRLVYR